MNLQELRSVQNTERQRDSLQELRPSFYQDVGEYIADLEAEREVAAERAADPFASPEVTRLTNEIQTATDVVEAIYERRMGKLVKQASLAAAGLEADDEGLTAEEADLFEDLVARIETNKTRVFDVLEGRSQSASSTGEHSDAPDRPPEPPRSSPDSPPVEPASADEPADGLTPADVMGGEPSVPADDTEPAAPDLEEPTSAAADESTAVDRVTVRITRDVGSIFGIDEREYTLTAEDVVTLPRENAEPLLARDAAEPLE